MRKACLLFVALLVVLLPAKTIRAEEALSQADLLINLVDGIGLSYGLPDEPSDEDYLTIVGSNRTLRIEAEDVYAESDFVSVKSFRNFGDYSGTGWVSGVNTSTLLHLDFLLPWSGTYEMSSALRFPGHTFDFGNQLLIGSGADKFTVSTLGSVNLTAGPQAITVELPPNGSIDYLEMTSEPQPPIMPLAGWNLDQDLTTTALAEVSLTALSLLALLPDSERTQLIEAESSESLSEEYITDQRHLGSPSGEAWVRAGISPLEIKVPFQTRQPEVLNMVLRGLGEEDIAISINGLPLANLVFQPYMSELETEIIALPAGNHILTAMIPPRSGLDSLVLKFRNSDADTLKGLAGLDSSNESVATTMNQLIALLAGLSTSH